ncbi:disintegrin and metalloproteinase domain-containing protein 10 [Callorhinchus milii]|uniref:disintegrin and metalloproteinase domain-containing protein 10 n=1 Tax=Callorhinchus milii TaxID=7868 RepID=UPI001C3FB617|nr:disintegrin and metalloproteinase domain-containing protein 10 [Callorhinchus milii]
MSEIKLHKGEIKNVNELMRGSEGGSLSPFIKQYEGLSYSRNAVHQQHQRVRRSVCKEDALIHLQFSTRQRQFWLRLKRDSSMFTEDFIMKGKNLPGNGDLSHIYSGELQDEAASYCHGSIIDGRFEGFIQTQTGRYYVEPIERYSKGEDFAFHSLIYHQDDIVYTNLTGQREWCLNESAFGAPHQYQHGFQEENQKAVSTRAKREVDYSRTTCLLHLHADYQYFRRMGSTEAVTAQIANYLKAVNDIYQFVDFEGIRFINFRVKALTIDSEEDNLNPMHARFIGVEKLLILHSEHNWNEYCLSYLLTARDFGKTLGIAWVGSPGNYGGICSRYGPSDKSAFEVTLNTGLITLQRFAYYLPLRLVHIVLAHELGHSLGSLHDLGEECIPPESSSLQGKGGNFLMFPHASDGRQYNNNRFSPCSIRSISKLLKAKKDECFSENDSPICGNRIVEEGEQCDVGENRDDPCCFGAGHMQGASCRLKPGKRCSPTQGPCCSHECVLKARHRQCRKETECASDSYCDGVSATCPDSPPKANHTPCLKGKRLCLDGQCSESLCVKHGLEECNCGTVFMQEKCYLCCSTPGDPGTCASTSSVLLAEYFNRSLLTLPPGAPCRNKQGYCDVFSVCRLVDDDGPIAKLKNAIFDPEDFEGVAEWMKTHWWAILLAILTLGGMMASTVFILGRTLDSKQGEQGMELQVWE